MFQRIYKFCISILLLNIIDSRSYDFKEAIGILGNQTLIAFSHLLSKCEYVPEEIQNGGNNYNY